jgi:hypothetical protein
VPRPSDQRDDDAAAGDELAAARDQAGHEGDAQARNREHLAQERETGALQRDWAATTRDPQAQCRELAADQRERPSEARQRGHDEQAVIDRELDASDRRQAAGRALAAQEVSQASAALVGRFIAAKQRELAAHRATALVYEQLAELEERFGHLARAAEARAQAGHARELHELAEGELAAYQARMTAIRGKRAAYRRNGRCRPVG